MKPDSHHRPRDGGSATRRRSISGPQGPQSNDGDKLHLPNLFISAFRGIDSLRVPRLKRVTLFVGKNGVGKTTLLEAVRIYASRGKASDLASILHKRGEISTAIDEDGDEVDSPNYLALFYGRGIKKGQTISIGFSDLSKQVKIEPKPLKFDDVGDLKGSSLDSLIYEKAWVLRVTSGQTGFTIPWIYSQGHTGNFRLFRHRTWRRLLLFEDSDETSLSVRCVNLGPSLMSTQEIAQLWEEIALTDNEEQAVEALKLVFGNSIERVAVVSRDATEFKRHRRDVRVRIGGLPSPVPLQSLGDGAVRFFGTGLALATSRNGFLTIDEAENGIHHSLHRDYWRMILQMARKNNVQVIATTHGWDCVSGFAQAVSEMNDAEGSLIRLEKSNGDLRAVAYPSDALLTAAAQGIEMR